jgi:hypothetical protein
VSGFIQRGADPDQAEHPAPGHHELLAFPPRAGVKNMHLIGHVGQATNDGSRPRRLRVALGGEYDIDRGRVGPFRRLSLEKVDQVALQPGHDGLCFWVTKTNVELENLRSFAGQGQPGVEEAVEGVARLGHRGQGWLDDRGQRLVDKTGGQVVDR